MAISWLWVCCLGFQVTPNKKRWVSFSVTFSFSGYFLLGLTWGEVWEEGLRVEVQIPPEGLMVETEALNPDEKEGKSEAWVSEPGLRIQMQNHAPFSSRWSCSDPAAAEIFIALCICCICSLYVFSMFSTITSILKHTISSGELVWTEWNFFSLLVIPRRPG